MFEKYRIILKNLRVDDERLACHKQTLLAHDCTVSSEEALSWVSCVLALKAASHNNLGVGAVLVKDGKILHEACNEMLHPYFRSDAHPEMLVLNEYESQNKNTPGQMKAITMYSSLEPCPMCLTRLSTTGIGAVKYVAGHDGSGMAHCIDKLPVLWQIFCENIKIGPAACSDELKKLSFDILDISVQKNVPDIFTYKEGVLPEERLERYTKNF